MKAVKTKDIAAIGNRIKQVRKHLQIQQKDMALKLGITNAHLSDIEKGKASPSIEVLMKITKIYDMNLEYLFFGRGKMLYSDENSESDRFTFDASITSTKKLIWMLNKSDYFSALVQGAAIKLMIEQNDFILKTVLEAEKIKTRSQKGPDS